MFSIPPEKIKILTKEELSLYRLDQLDMVKSEERSLQKSKGLGVSRVELMRREALAEERSKKECVPFLEKNFDTTKWGKCHFAIRKEVGLSR